jgi:hypothetical protein
MLAARQITGVASAPGIITMYGFASVSRYLPLIACPLDRLSSCNKVLLLLLLLLFYCCHCYLYVIVAIRTPYQFQMFKAGPPPPFQISSTTGNQTGGSSVGSGAGYTMQDGGMRWRLQISGRFGDGTGPANLINLWVRYGSTKDMFVCLHEVGVPTGECTS